MPNKWEIWYAKVKFEDDPTQVKSRPVLVISPEKCYILSLKITGTAPRGGYSGEYALLKWKEAGLNKQSTVRASKRLRLVSTDFIHKIGRLHPVDIIAIQKIIGK